MEGSIQLTAAQRKMVLSVYRSGPDAHVARRAHILLLLDRGHSYRAIMDIDFCSSDLVNHVKRQFLDGGVEAVLATAIDEPSVPFWHVLVAGWILHQTPRDFGYFRSRWTCELFAELLREEHGIKVSGETVRRGLHRLGFAWRRPRPVVGPTDPDYAAKLRRIRRLLIACRPTKSPSSKTKSICT